MFTFIIEEKQPLLVDLAMKHDVFMLHPFSPEPTKVPFYKGNGMLGTHDCFHWVATHNIPYSCHLDNFDIMREAGWLIYFNTRFYQVERTIYFLRQPNPIIVKTLRLLNPAFKKFEFAQFSEFAQISSAYPHKLNDYIPLNFPIKLSLTELLSYYYVKPSKIVYC